MRGTAAAEKIREVNTLTQPNIFLVRENKVPVEVAANLEHPRLTPLRILHHDVANFGFIRSETWDRYRNEKYSRVAEALTQTTQLRPDIYTYDPILGDVIISETDGINPRYTMGMVFENGYAKSKKEAAANPALAFQLQRDQYFLETWRAVEQMLKGETDFDTIKMISTFPIEQWQTKSGRLTCEDKAYGDGVQYEYLFRRGKDEEGNIVLEMATGTLFCPKQDFEPEPTAIATQYGKQAAAFILNRNGYSDAVYSQSSDTYGGNMMTATTGKTPLSQLFDGDRALYDQEIERLTGRPSYRGKQESRHIDAYHLFDLCQNEWAAATAFDEMLAWHLKGSPLDPKLRRHLLNLIAGYQKEEKWHASVTKEEFNEFHMQVWKGEILPGMALVCSEVLLYAHTALFSDKADAYLQGKWEHKTAVKNGDELIDGYSQDTNSSGARAIEEDRVFSDCEDKNQITGEAVAAFAAKNNVSLDEARRRLQKEQQKKFESIAFKTCRSCETDANVGRCDVCEDCEKAHDNGGDVGLAVYSALVKKRRQAEQKGKNGTNVFEHRGRQSKSSVTSSKKDLRKK